MLNYFNKLKQFNMERKNYYKDESDLLYVKNFKMLKDVSLTVAFMTTIMIFLTPYIIASWTITPQHVGLAIVSLLIWIILNILEKYKRVTEKLTGIMCIISGMILFAFVIAIDIFPFCDQPSQFMEAAVIIIPLLFDFRFLNTYGFILVFQILDVVLLLRFKTSHMAQNDIFSLITGSIISLTAWWFMTRLRVTNYIMKTRYRILSMTDSLTGILNKGACTDKVHLCLQHAAQTNECCALLLMDIDNFKRINDSYGHQMGDSVLEQYGMTLMNFFRNTDIVGRFGGDEFIVLLRNIQNMDSINRRCEELLELLNEISFGRHKNISCSIGIAIAHDGCYDFDKLLGISDKALYKAKLSKENKYIIGSNDKPED